MATIKTISARDFLSGQSAREAACSRCRVDKHDYRAEWVPGVGIVVKDPSGNQVEVSFSGTTDNRTCTAYVEGVGYIGGWTYPHRKEPFKSLVASINRGNLYHDMNRLPRSHRAKTCPHCGGEL